MGLPWNRHVSFRATWMERDPELPDDEPDDPDFDDPLFSELVAETARGAAALERMAGALERLAKHFGAG